MEKDEVYTTTMGLIGQMNEVAADILVDLEGDPVHLFHYMAKYADKSSATREQLVILVAGFQTRAVCADA